MAPTGSPLLQVAQAALSTQQCLSQWILAAGLEALGEMLRAEAQALAGEKGRHVQGRTHNHWGFAQSELPLGGRKISVTRPRVRRVGGGEATLPSIEAFTDEDALPDRVQEQILVGVSTRGYARSLGDEPDEVASRGTSKSAASRNLIKRTTAKMEAFLARRLEHAEFPVLMLDGIHLDEKAVIVCLGVRESGVKEPLGIWCGSTENSIVCTELLNELITRGLKIEGRTLFVIDGGKGIRKALKAVFGDRAVVQRCQLHKRRNLKAHLPRAMHKYVDKQLAAAYRAGSYSAAKSQLLALQKFLTEKGEDDAARSLSEGMEETLTLLRLGLKGNLLRSLATTNAIENLMGTIRRITRNVKRWEDESMIRRWVAMALEEAQTKFRKIKGYQQLNELIQALKVDEAKKAA